MARATSTSHPLTSPRTPPPPSLGPFRDGCCSAKKDARAFASFLNLSIPAEGGRLACDATSTHANTELARPRNGRSACPGTRCPGLPAGRGPRGPAQVRCTNGLCCEESTGVKWEEEQYRAVPPMRPCPIRNASSTASFPPIPETADLRMYFSARLAAADLVSLSSCTGPSLTTLHPADARILYIQSRRIPPPAPPLPLSDLIPQAPWGPHPSLRTSYLQPRAVSASRS